MRHFLSKGGIAALVLLSALLAGCVSLKAVQDYSATSQKTLESAQTVGKDFYDSCLRSNKYIPYAEYSKCAQEQEAAKGIQGAVKILDAYVAALGALASDEAADFSVELGGFVKEAKAAKILQDNKVTTAVEHLAVLLIKPFVSTYQQKQLAQRIIECDGAVAEATAGLSAVFEVEYPRAIRGELVLWGQRHAQLERLLRDSKPLDWEAYASEQWKARDGIQAKASASLGLARAIKTIGTAHAMLKKDAETLDAKEVAAAVRTFVATAAPVVKEVQTAFGTN